MSAPTILILLSVTTFLFLVLWTTACHQLCITHITHGRRLWNTFCIAAFCSFSMIWSGLGYLSRLYPHITVAATHIDLVSITHISNALMMLSGMHIYRALMLSVMDRVHAIPSASDTNSSPTRLKWVRATLNTMELMMAALLAMCYVFAYEFASEWPWMHSFYIAFGAVTLAQTVYMVLVIRSGATNQY